MTQLALAKQVRLAPLFCSSTPPILGKRGVILYGPARLKTRRGPTRSNHPWRDLLKSIDSLFGLLTLPNGNLVVHASGVTIHHITHGASSLLEATSSKEIVESRAH